MTFKPGHPNYSKMTTMEERLEIAKNLTREDVEPMIMEGAVTAYKRVRDRASKAWLWEKDPKLYISANQWLAEMGLGKSSTAIVGVSGKPIEFVYRVIHSVEELPKVVEYKQIENVKDEISEGNGEGSRDQGTTGSTVAISTT